MNPDIHALSGAYAVDALDDVERARFESHLADCADCREEVASLTEAAGLLGAATATTPPPGLRDRVLADIAKVRPLPPLVPTAPVADSSPVADELSARRDVARNRRLPRLPRLLATAAAVFALGAGVTVWHPWNDDSSQVVPVADQVLQAPDASFQTLEIAGAKATLVRSPSLGRAVLVTEDMPAPPEGKVYEVWLQNAEGKMVPAGLMPNAADQHFLLEGDAASAKAAGITVEPAGGSPVPTSDALAIFEFEDKA